MSSFTLPPGLAGLADDPHWVNWNLEPRPGDPKPTKVPYTPSLRGKTAKAKAGDPTTWGDFATASAAAAAGRFTGIGYEFHVGAGKVFIDLDHVIDPETRKVDPRARAIVALANSYAEVSPSGTGIHIIGKAELPRPEIAADRHGKKKGQFELYGGAHFATMTCKPFPGYDTLRPIDAERMRLLFALMWPEDAAPKPERVAPPPPLAPAIAGDAALLDKAFAAKNGDDLYRRHQGTYLLEDESADDWAYLMALAFWTQRDPLRMRRLADASGRTRAKWFTRRGSGDLLDYNIGKACAEQHEVYDPERATGARVVFSVPDEGDVRDVAAIAVAFAERDSVIARLEADNERLTEQLAHCRDEHKRKDATIEALQATVAAHEVTAAHTDQTIGGSAFDLAEAITAAYQQGDTLVQDGKEYARVVYSQAANRRSATTVGRAGGRIAEAGTVPTITREEQIETPTYKGFAPITYFHIPEERRANPAKVVLTILPPCAPKKHGGKRRKIELPEFEKPVEGPVKLLTEHKKIWSSVATEEVLKVEAISSTTEYFSDEGEQLTVEEVQTYQESLGLKVKTPVPLYRPVVQQPLAMVDADLFDRPSALHDLDTPRPPLRFPSPQCQWPGCVLDPVENGLCGRHAAQHAMTGAD